MGQSSVFINCSACVIVADYNVNILRFLINRNLDLNRRPTLKLRALPYFRVNLFAAKMFYLVYTLESESVLLSFKYSTNTVFSNIHSCTS